MNVDTLTKEKFMLYLKERRSLDTKFGKTVVNKFVVHQEKNKVKTERLKERYATDDEYRERKQEMGRTYYAKKIASKKIVLPVVETVVVEKVEVEVIPDVVVSDTESEPIKRQTDMFKTMNLF